MGNDNLYVVIASQHVAAYHVRHGAGCLGEVLLHGERRLRHHLAVHGLGTMWMEYDDSFAFIEESKERVEFRRTKIQSLHVSSQFDAVGLQRVERILRLSDGSIHVGEG